MVSLHNYTSLTRDGLDVILSLSQQRTVVSITEELVSMSFETAADMVGIILLQVVEEKDVQAAQIIDIHEDLLPEVEKKEMKITIDLP